jgi:hypothetical protein
MAIDGKAPYPNLVVGTITEIATPDESKALFSAGRKRGWLRTLSSDSAEFAAKIEPVTMTLPSGKTMIGRFSPHTPGYEFARPNDPYLVAVGCVEVLCAASDRGFLAGYRPGIFRMRDGVEFDPFGTRPIPGGAVIDPISMRPKVPAKAAALPASTPSR